MVWKRLRAGLVIGLCTAVDAHAPGPGRRVDREPLRYSTNVPDGDAGLQTVGSASQAAMTAAEHCDLHVERS